MVIKTKVIIYAADDVITSDIKDLYSVAIDNNDMESLEGWLRHNCPDNIADVFNKLEECADKGMSIADFIELYENKYEEYKKDKMEDLLDYDDRYHSREIEVSVDVAVN